MPWVQLSIYVQANRRNDKTTAPSACQMARHAFFKRVLYDHLYHPEASASSAEDT